MLGAIETVLDEKDCSDFLWFCGSGRFGVGWNRTRYGFWEGKRVLHPKTRWNQEPGCSEPVTGRTFTTLGALGWEEEYGEFFCRDPRDQRHRLLRVTAAEKSDEVRVQIVWQDTLGCLFPPHPWVRCVRPFREGGAVEETFLVVDWMGKLRQLDRREGRECPSQWLPVKSRGWVERVAVWGNARLDVFRRAHSKMDACLEIYDLETKQLCGKFRAIKDAFPLGTTYNVLIPLQGDQIWLLNQNWVHLDTLSHATFEKRVRVDQDGFVALNQDRTLCQFAVTKEHRLVLVYKEPLPPHEKLIFPPNPRRLLLLQPQPGGKKLLLSVDLLRPTESLLRKAARCLCRFAAPTPSNVEFLPDELQKMLLLGATLPL